MDYKGYQLKITLIYHIIILQGMNYTTYFPTQLGYPQTSLFAINPCTLYQAPLCYSYIYQLVPNELDFYLLNQNILAQDTKIFGLDNAQEKLILPPSQEPSCPKSKNQIIRQVSSPVIIKYAKKNAQSNVINQVFSFLSIRSKSIKALAILLQADRDLIHLYYELMKQLKKKNKKYINRCYLKELLELEDGHPAQAIIKKIDSNNRFGPDKFRKIIRTLTFYYFRNVCIPTILTSAKLDKQTKNQHLQRKSEIETYLVYHIKNSSNNN